MFEKIWSFGEFRPKKEVFFGWFNQPEKNTKALAWKFDFRIDVHQGKARRSLDLKNKRLPF